MGYGSTNVKRSKQMAKAAPASPDVMPVFGFRLHPTLIAAVRSRAIAEGVQVSDVARAAIAHYLKSEQQKETPAA